MGNMFDECKLFNQDLSNWNTKNIESTQGMFEEQRPYSTKTRIKEAVIPPQFLFPIYYPISFHIFFYFLLLLIKKADSVLKQSPPNYFYLIVINYTLPAPKKPAIMKIGKPNANNIPFNISSM